MTINYNMVYISIPKAYCTLWIAKLQLYSRIVSFDLTRDLQAIRGRLFSNMCLNLTKYYRTLKLQKRLMFDSLQDTIHAAYIYTYAFKNNNINILRI